MVAREDEPSDSGRDVHGHRHGAHARAERRGEEAAVLWADERAAGDRLAGRDLVAHDRAEQFLGIAVRLAVDVIGALHELLGPGLEGETVGIDDRANRKRLLYNEHFRPERNGGSGSSLLRAGAGEHVPGHDRGDHRNDQRSNEQRELLHIHGEIASPKRAT